MTARNLVLILLVGCCPVSIWAQGGGACTQVVVWGMGGGAGCGSYPDASWLAAVAGNQAEFGGVGPACTYTPNPNFPNCGIGACHSVGLQCQPGQTPPAPPVGGCPECTNSAGAPIALANGNTFIRQPDVRIPGLGGSLTLERTWNSTWVYGIHI